MYIEKISKGDINRFVTEFDLKVPYSHLNEYTKFGTPKGSGIYEYDTYGVNLVLTDFTLKQGHRLFLNKAKSINQKAFGVFMVSALPKELREQYMKDYNEFWTKNFEDEHAKKAKSLKDELVRMKLSSKEEKKPEVHDEKVIKALGRIKPVY